MTTTTETAIEALKFYANRYTWDSTKQRTNITAADIDRGERARDALTVLRAPVDCQHDYGEEILQYCIACKLCGTVNYRTLPAAGGMKDGDLYDLADRCGLLNKDGFRVVHRDDLVRAFRNLLATQPEARSKSGEKKPNE